MSWFSKNKQDANFESLETSVATLLIHAARLDEKYSQDEKLTINKCLVDLHFNLIFTDSKNHCPYDRIATISFIKKSFSNLKLALCFH